MRIVLATHNVGKAAQMREMLGILRPNLQTLTLADFPNAPEPQETGSTYEENATIKAVSAANVTGMPSLADDAGLEIDALAGAPGLFSARFGGKELPFPEKILKLLDLMADIPEPARTARFRCAIAFAHDDNVRTYQADCEGTITTAPRGTSGFGYDPIFLIRELDRTMAEFSVAEKLPFSHRGKVLRSFLADVPLM